MKCTIPGANLKVIARAIQALSRIGDELYVEPDVNSMSFRSVNSSRSAYASFTFNRSFFAFYKHEPSQSIETSQEDSKCKISMKSCLPVFRSPVMLDRKVENCLMHLDDNGSKLVFEMKFRHGISKTHFLPVIECATLQVVYTKDDSFNCLQAQVQLFQDTVHNFNNNQEEVTLAVTSQKTYLRSYVDGSLSSSKVKYTEISLDSAEFDKYTVKNETAITFSLKEFRALLAFAEATGQSVEACFEIGGKPVVFGVKHENSYEANFVLSTLSPEIEVQTPTPQQMLEQNSNTPLVITAATSSKGNSAQLNAKENSFQQSRAKSSASSNNLLQQKTPDLQQGTLQVMNRLSVRRAESPSLLSAMKSGRSLHNSVLNKQNQSRVEDHHGQTQNSVHAQSEERTQRDLNSPVLDMNTPLMTMSNTSSILQLRESDEDDTIASSPQPQRKRPRLFDIFDSTFDPAKIPGHNVILAGDSGDEQA